MRNFFIFIALTFLVFSGDIFAQSVETGSVRSRSNYEEEELDSVDPVDEMIFKIAPNPAREQARIIYGNLPGDGLATIKLLDQRGREIKSVRVGGEDERTGTVQLTTQGLASGFYFVRMLTSFGVETRKIFIR
ncbi:MAG: T9SS type A sorting domain-containing protein [Bacteroidota bacterium]